VFADLGVKIAAEHEFKSRLAPVPSHASAGA
jgi:hypothetical protein